MHKMEETPKVLTIIGLVVEGLAVLVFAGANVLVRILEAIPKSDLIAEGMTPEEADIFLSSMGVLGTVFIIIGIMLVIMFSVNLFLFTKLIRQKFNVNQAKNVYLYQGIWGGISLSFNTITGVLYIISAVYTHSRGMAQEVVEDK